MAAKSSGSHGKPRTEEGGRPCDGLGEAEAHPESNCGGGVAGEALWPANSTTASCGSGESSVKLASPGVLFVFDWRGGSMKSSAARLLDKVGAAGLLTGHVGASPWPARVSGLRGFFVGRTNRGRGWRGE